jgi:ankyrin repeat protein
VIDRITDGRTDLVFEHVAAGGDARATDAHGCSLIRWCAYYGDVSAIHFLLSHGETLDSLGSNYDLNGAAFHGHWRLCQFLIENGADVNRALPDTGETPLHAALCKPNRPTYAMIVGLLLNRGSNPNARTKPGAVTECFMREARTRGETPLHRAAAFGTEASIRLLLDAGADPRAKDASGDTPLAWASWYARPAFLLQQLCYDTIAIHPTASESSRSEHAMGWNAMDSNLLGKPHF